MFVRLAVCRAAAAIAPESTTAPARDLARRRRLTFAAAAARNQPMSRSAQALSALRSVYKNPDLRRVELAWGASIATEWAHYVALGVFAYDEGGAAAVGIAGLVRMLPAAIVAPFAASFGDRFRRERFLAAIALVGSGALAASAVAFFAGRNVVAIFALAGVVGVTTTLFRPALQAILPSLARTPDELIASNGATSTIESLGTLVGPLVAGVLVAVANVGVVLIAASVVLLTAAVLLARLVVEGTIQRAIVDAGNPRELVLGGFRVVATAWRPRLIVGLITAQGFVRGCLNVLMVVAAFELFGAGDAAVGYMAAALGVGGLVGAFAALGLEGRRLGTPLGIAIAFWGLPIALVAAWPNLVFALALLAVVGAANSVEDVAAFTLLQRIVPDDVLTRVLGVAWGLVMGAVALGSIAAPAIVGAVGARAAFVVAGAILPVVAIAVARLLRTIDAEAHAPRVELEVIDHVSIFAPLSVAAKEHVAARLVPLTIEAGEVVVRAGDVGDRFYVVAEGGLDVDAGGRHSTSGPGDFFGEVALLRQVPRTATVQALMPSRLYALDRSDFLAAVTGHSAVRSAGEAIAVERLGCGSTG
jgi:MFS family permease